jgi:hypothetical protein
MTIPKRKPGRPKAEPTTPISIRLTKAQHTAYIELGGARWVKRLLSEDIDRARLWFS